MRRVSMAIVVAMAVAAGVAIAQQNQAQIDLQAAIRTENVDDNLQAAIRQYGNVVSTHKADRRVAATALVRMAECYQKLGDAQARTIYQRVLREYGDQQEAVTTARARLGVHDVLRRAAIRGDRAVWKGPDVDLFGTVSPDGRYLTYTDWATTNNLMVRDLEAGTSRALTVNTTYGEFGYAEWSVISKNGEQVAYGWTPSDTDRHELRVMDLSGGGIRSSRRVLQSEGRDSLRPFDWSPDGEWIAALLQREDRSSQIALVRLRDGATRVLKTVDWRGVEKIVFSPDGAYIAYDLLVGNTRAQEHIFVMAADGSRETAVVTDASHNHVMGWSRDGHLLFASDRSGAVGLWSISVAGGKPAAAPALEKGNIGSSWSLGLTASNTLYVWKDTAATYVKVAQVDSSRGTLVESATHGFQRFIESRGRPDWSENGKHLSYISCGPTGGGPCAIAILAIDTGVVRNVPHELGYLDFPRLSPDGQRIVTGGRDLKGRRGIYVIDTRTGQTSLITVTEPPNARGVIDWSSDASSFYYQERQGRDFVVGERDLESGKEREVFRTSLAGARNIRISPDGQLVGLITTEAGERNSTFVVMPITGGPSRQLLRVKNPEFIAYDWQWTPDSAAVLLRKGANDGRPTELWSIPLTGDGRKLSIDTRKWVEGGHVALHPDGRHVAFVATAGEPGSEVWALENFLPQGGASQ